MKPQTPKGKKENTLDKQSRQLFQKKVETMLPKLK